MASAVAPRATLPECSDHLDGLLEHLQALVDRGPAVAEDVLVEGLAAPEAEGEAALQQDRRCGGRLSDDRRMDPHGRARDGGHQADVRGRLRDGPDHRPDQRTVGLLLIPGVEVV